MTTDNTDPEFPRFMLERLGNVNRGELQAEHEWTKAVLGFAAANERYLDYLKARGVKSPAWEPGASRPGEPPWLGDRLDQVVHLAVEFDEVLKQPIGLLGLGDQVRP